MVLSRCRRLWPVALIVGSTLAAAGAPNPLDASAAVAPASPPSAFASYRRHVDATPRDWKATNDTVGRIGGWRAYAREASEPAAAVPRAPAASAPAASQHRHGHPGHPGHPGQPGKAAP